MYLGTQMALGMRWGWDGGGMGWDGNVGRMGWGGDGLGMWRERDGDGMDTTVGVGGGGPHPPVPRSLRAPSPQQAPGEPQGWARLFCVLRGTNLLCYRRAQEAEGGVQPALTIAINKVRSRGVGGGGVGGAAAGGGLTAVPRRRRGSAPRSRRRGANCTA